MSEAINPYIAGSPITGTEMFFGREDVFDFVKRTLSGRHRDNVIVLYGQRRTGKTSVLYHIRQHLGPDYICVLVDLHALALDGVAGMLWEVASYIIRILRRDHGIEVSRPDRAEFMGDARDRFRNEFLGSVHEAIGPTSHLLLMIDEVGRLREKIDAHELESNIFEYLRYLMQHYDWLDFLYSLGSSLEELQQEYSLLFSVALYKKISFLGPPSARDLITKPIQSYYHVEPATVDRILEVTSGHPYYTQLICHCLFSRWQQAPADLMKVQDVTEVLSLAIELGSANLKFVWEQSDDGERAVLAGLAACPVGKSRTSELRSAWSHLDVLLPDAEIARSIRSLIARDILVGEEDYRFTVELQRLWVKKERRLDWVKEELSAALPKWRSTFLAERMSRRAGVRLAFAMAILMLLSLAVWAGYRGYRLSSTLHVWATRSADNSRSGWNQHETVLTQASVAARGLLKTIVIPLGYSERGMEAQPLIMPQVPTPHGDHDIMVLPSMADVVRAVDAGDGAVIWEVKLGTPVSGSAFIDMYRINDHWGCLSTGVIDPDSKRLYQVCWVSPDHSGNPQTARFYMFVLNLADGSQAVPPVLIEGTSGNQNFNSQMRKQRSSLLETNVHSVKTVFGCSGSVYETGRGASGFCFAFDINSNTVSAILATSNGRGGGVWMAGQGPAADNEGFLYLTTANGLFDGVNDWGESFLKLKYTPPAKGTPASLQIVDHWTPWTDIMRDHGTGRWSDQDLGSSGPACIFAIGVCVVAGKDGIAYPIKTSHMGATTLTDLTHPKENCAKLAASPVWLTVVPTQTPPAQGSVDPCPDDPASLNLVPNGLIAHLYMTPVQFYDSVLKSWSIFAWGSNGKLRKWAISDSGTLHLIAESREYSSPDARDRSPGGMPGAMCSGSSNGADPNSAILVCSVPNGDANSQVVAGRIMVYDPVHLAADGSIKLLWDSQLFGVTFEFNKFDPPVIDGGHIYVPNYGGGVDVYALAQEPLH